MIDRSSLRGDLLGGVTAGIVALPLALAFGVASGAGALAGVYGAILVGFFSALVGGTPSQISGPTGPMTVVMAAVLTHFATNPGLAFLAVILAGILQIVFGLTGIGRFIKLVPQPVVSGFMSGIGIIIIILQLPPMLGHSGPDGGILVKLGALPAMLSTINESALVLGLIGLAIMLWTPTRISVYIPRALSAVIIGSLLGFWLFPAAPTIGTIPTGIPDIQLPSVSLADVPLVLEYGLILAFLGSIDSLLTSLVADSMTRTYHDSNRELVGQGLGNLAAGLLGGIPGAGATMRTMVNIRAGGRTRLSGVVHALVLLAILLQFSELASHVPLAVLAGVLMKVGWDIIDWPRLKRVHAAPRTGVLIMLITLGMTVFVDLMAAVAVGTVIASIVFVNRVADAQVSSASFAFGKDQIDNLGPEEEEILDQADGRIVLFHIEGPLSFGSARDVSRILQRKVEKDVLAVDLTHVPFIDSSAAAALEEVIVGLREQGDEVILFGVRDKVLGTLQKAGVAELLGTDRIAPDRLSALKIAWALLTK